MARKEEIDKEIKSIDNSYCTVTSACEAAIEWADRTMIEKACKWIEENIGKHIYINTDWNIPEIDYDFFINFKKAMEYE